MGNNKLKSNVIIKVDKVLFLDYKKEVILADLTKEEAFEEALRDFVKKKKLERK